LGHARRRSGRTSPAWHDAGVTEQAERYDRIADGYARWWGPIIAPAAVGVLDLADEAVRAGARTIVDIGTGTGVLAIAAVRRWPGVRVVGLDASAGMIDKARADAAAALTPAEIERVDFRVAFADDLGLAEGSADVAVSSFVLQLVPNRFRALREARRVLRPGGVLAWITWLAGSRPWLPDDDFDDALDDIGEETREWDDRPGDLPDAAAAIAQMRRAGFRDVTAVAGTLIHAFDVDGAVGFLTEFDEEDLIDSLGRDRRRRFEAALRRRLERRPGHELALHNATVSVRGVR
ncbi:MAG TPA: class I SAM-dependent methyltransferase, partial [Candidatus Limnocylindrales bacterium]|nr:class I SAM-dependent methyltransferase [Candidatus Limnocylindrales bacterium]